MAGGGIDGSDPAMMIASWGSATSRPSEGTSLTSGEAVRMRRNRSRSSRTPTRGPMTSTAMTVEAHRGQPSWSSDTYARADTKAWAPNAKLNTPDAL